MTNTGVSLPLLECDICSKSYNEDLIFNCSRETCITNVCPRCRKICVKCEGKFYCPAEMECECERCEAFFCPEHGDGVLEKCVDCELQICEKCRIMDCKVCDVFYCRTCYTRLITRLDIQTCSVCKSTGCERHVKPCVECKLNLQFVCNLCQVQGNHECSECDKKTLCQNCFRNNHSRCKKREIYTVQDRKRFESMFIIKKPRLMEVIEV